MEREEINRDWFQSLYHARAKIEDYYYIYCYKRKQKVLGRRSPYQYIKHYFPDSADKHPFAISDSMSRVALDVGRDSGATYLALDKEDENEKFVHSENQDLLLN